ncbi:putative RNA-directed DNA polymerase from transposon BS [Caerostris extrusa]|uniref:RNA-directed DNA polymerase from transposon BS n=1 Tax=Caerostris extrusa TaxID=172846 RepID=A0AAV4XDW2_CAEEX|nr:putative RNA-directed DNA polymerase from transposon BS [Caerostris extrusa]
MANKYRNGTCMPSIGQLALEIINNISPRALVIYTDGSKSDSGRTGSGIFMKTSTGEFRYRFRNPDHSSVFRSELTAISEALSLALDFKVPDVWILIDKSFDETYASGTNGRIKQSSSRPWKQESKGLAKSSTFFTNMPAA